tara:strand:- start:497 stop:1135 length:639 start_codon:yes stop_codon:yes gene_type:complete
MTQKRTPTTWRSALLLVASPLLALPVFADHPGENLNQVMAAKEAAFEPILPGDAPDLAWIGAAHESTSLNALRGKIVVLSFVPEGCGDPCEAQQATLTETLTALNSSAMRDMVVFVALSEEPQRDPTAQNWISARTPNPESLANASVALAGVSERNDQTPQVHLLNRNGQQVGIFHGADFKPLNLLLYINGLTNAHPHVEPSYWQRLIGWFS